jgi:hypothetical protein
MLHWLLRERGVKKPDPKKQISDVARQHYPSVDYPEAEKVFNCDHIIRALLILLKNIILYNIEIKSYYKRPKGGW